MLFRVTARWRPSLCPSLLEKRASARALEMIILPSGSVSRMGSGEALTMFSSSSRSRCTLCADSAVAAAGRRRASFCRSSSAAHRASGSQRAGLTSSSPCRASQASERGSGMARNSFRQESGARRLPRLTGSRPASANTSGSSGASRARWSDSICPSDTPAAATCFSVPDYASITSPLSSTRSRTSMRLVPPDALSTGIDWLLGLRPVAARPGLPPGRGRPARERFHLALQQADLLAERFPLQFDLFLAGSQVVVVTPPIEADLLRFVDRTHDQAHPDREQLDLRQRHLDVAGDDQSFIEHAIENVHETTALRASQLKVASHGLIPCSPTGRTTDKGGMR